MTVTPQARAGPPPAAKTATPEEARAALRQVEALIGEGRPRDARALFADVWNTDLPLRVREQFVNRLSSGETDAAETAAFLETLDGAVAGNPVVQVRLAVMKSRLGEADAALRLLGAASDSRPLPPYAAALRIDLLSAAGRHAEALETARRLSAEEPDDPRHAERLIIAAAMAGDAGLLEEALRRPLLRGSADWRLLFRFSRLALPPATVDRLFPLIARNMAGAVADERSFFHYAVCCAERGLVDEALQALGRIPPEHPAAYMGRPFEAALLRLKADGPGPARVVEDRLCDFQLVEAPGADTLLVVFGAVMGRFSYIPFSLLDGYLSRFGVHVAYVRDVLNSSYLRGLPSLGADEAATASALRAAADRLGVRLVFLGSSMGGFGAMRYAARTQADAALSLAGPTRLEKPAADGRRKPVGERIAKALRMLGEEADLLDDLPAASGTRFVYSYGELNERHLAQGRRLSHLPNVALRPLPGIADQFCALHSLASRRLDDLLQSDLGLPVR